MRILGVDPGTHHLGYGVLDAEGDRTSCVAWGTLEGGPSREIHQRLFSLHQALADVVERWRPDQLAIEEPFVAPARGAKSAVAVGQAQAVALLLAAAGGGLLSVPVRLQDGQLFLGPAVIAKLQPLPVD